MGPCVPAFEIPATVHRGMNVVVSSRGQPFRSAPLLPNACLNLETGSRPQRTTHLFTSSRESSLVFRGPSPLRSIKVNGCLLGEHQVSWILRAIVAVLAVALALPSWSARECCCSRRQRDEPQLHAASPLSPCCAARLLKAAQKRSTTSSATPVCGCNRELAPAGVLAASRSLTAAVDEAQRLVAFRIEPVTLEARGETLPQKARDSAPAAREPDLTQLCRSLT